MKKPNNIYHNKLFTKKGKQFIIDFAQELGFEYGYELPSNKLVFTHSEYTELRAVIFGFPDEPSKLVKIITDAAYARGVKKCQKDIKQALNID